MSTFKEAVEEILTKQCGLECEKVNENDAPFFCEMCQVDRILAAYKNVVEGMEQLDPFVQGNIVPLTAQFEACKKYLLEGLE